MTLGWPCDGDPAVEDVQVRYVGLQCREGLLRIEGQSKATSCPWKVTKTQPPSTLGLEDYLALFVHDRQHFD